MLELLSEFSYGDWKAFHFLQITGEQKIPNCGGDFVHLGKWCVRMMPIVSSTTKQPFKNKQIFSLFFVQSNLKTPPVPESEPLDPGRGVLREDGGGPLRLQRQGPQQADQDEPMDSQASRGHCPRVCLCVPLFPSI